MGGGRRSSAKRQGAQPGTGIGRAVFEGAPGDTPQHPHTLDATAEGAHRERSWLRTLTRRSVRRWPREIHASQELIGCPEKQAYNRITRGGPVIWVPGVAAGNDLWRLPLDGDRKPEKYLAT